MAYDKKRQFRAVEPEVRTRLCDHETVASIYRDLVERGVIDMGPTIFKRYAARIRTEAQGEAMASRSVPSDAVPSARPASAAPARFDWDLSDERKSALLDRLVHGAGEDAG